MSLLSATKHVPQELFRYRCEGEETSLERRWDIDHLAAGIRASGLTQKDQRELVEQPTRPRMHAVQARVSLTRRTTPVYRGGHDMRNQWLRHSTLAAVLLSIGLWMVPMPAPAVEVGEKAPDFLMHSTVGETVRLSEYQGKKNVLLFFFLAAFTGV
jgi:hypothetical protein